MAAYTVETCDAFLPPCLLQAVQRAIETSRRVEYLGLQADFGEVERMLEDLRDHPSSLGDS